MKILIVAPNFISNDSVASLRMKSLYNFLKNAGHTVFVLTGFSESQHKREKNLYYVKTIEGKGSSVYAYYVFKQNSVYYEEKFKKIVKKDRPEIVLISGGPFYTFGIANLSKKYNIPCILDFRDPWVFDVRGIRDLISLKRLSTRLVQVPYERSAVNAASAVVTVTNGWKTKFQKYYPFCKNKFYLIENGYDDFLLNERYFRDRENKNTNLVLGIFGKLFYYTPKYSKIFISAISELKNDLSILHIGTRESCAEKYLLEFGVDSSLICDTGFIPYADGMNQLSESDVLVIIDIRKDAMGTKIYDYIWMNKPILYIGPSNTELALFINRFENGFVCSNKKEIIQAVEKIKSFKIKHLDMNIDTKKYARSCHNKEWERLLKKFVI